MNRVQYRQTCLPVLPENAHSISCGFSGKTQTTHNALRRTCRVPQSSQRTSVGRSGRQLRQADGCAPVDLRYRVGVVFQRGRAPAGVAEPRGGVPEVEALGEHLARGVMPDSLDVEILLMSRLTPAARARPLIRWVTQSGLHGCACAGSLENR